MKEEEFKQYVIYSRKSKFTGKGESIENQIEMCRQHIASQFGEEYAKNALVYEDEGFSGGNIHRPQFKQMIKDSKEKNFTAIVVYRLDRISRNIGDFACLIKDLTDRKIDFISIKEQFDTSNPMGRAMMYISSVFSQLERETIAERIRDNMHELAKTGRWLGGTTPTGYESEGVTNVTIDGKTRKAFRLKEIPDEAAIVKNIFDVFIESNSLTKTDQYLLENRINTRRGNNFTRFAIRGILTNPVYMIADEDAYEYLVKNEVDLYSDKSAFDGVHGIMAYNRTDQQPGKANKPKPMDEWIVSVGKHKGFIPAKKWIQVQNMLEVNKSKVYRKPRSHVALLSGLLICGKCGDFMRPKLSTRKTADGETIYTYLCNTKERSRGHCCNIKNANGNMLDAKVIEVVKKLSSQASELTKQMLENKKQIAVNREGYDKEVARYRQMIADNDKEIKALVNSLAKASGTPAEDYIMQQIDELHEKGKSWQKHLEELEFLVSEHRFADIEFDIIEQMISSFADNIDDMGVDQKRAAIRTLIRQIVWDGEKAHMYLFGNDGEYDFPTIAGSDSESPLSEDSKRNTYVFSQH